MYLGNSSMTDDKSYFLPLLPLWRKNAQEGDKCMASKVASLEKLTMIQIITNDVSHGLPQSAKLFFSHGGYKLILANADTGDLVFAIRDIKNVSKDNQERESPFLLVIVGSSESEKCQLERVAAFAASNLETFSKKIAGLFNYDAEKNGISFDLATLTAYINDIAEVSDNVLLTLKGVKPVLWEKADIPLLVLPEGIVKKIAIRELGLYGKRTNFVELLDIIPLDNHDRVVAILKKLKQKAAILSKRKVLSFFVCAALLGLIGGYLVSK